MNEQIRLDASWVILGARMKKGDQDGVIVMSCQGKDLITAKVETHSPQDITLEPHGPLIVPPSRHLLIVEMKNAKIVQSAGSWAEAINIG